MAARGFVRLSEREMRGLITGNSLKLFDTFSHYARGAGIRVRESNLSGGLVSRGTWTVKNSNLCHSVREGHEFCSGLFFRGNDLVCWPAIGLSPDDTDYLSHCSILRGDLTRSGNLQASRVLRNLAPARPRPQPTPAAPRPPSLETVIAGMRTVPARDGVNAMAQRGFVRLRENELQGLVAGNTVKVLNAFGFFAKDRTVRVMETSVGTTLESQGTWTIKNGNLCHSVREGHEFCTGMFFRGNDLLCWPAFGWSLEDTDYIRRCSIIAGDQARANRNTRAALVTRNVEPPPRPRPATPAPRAAPPSLESVLANMRAVPAQQGIRQMASMGFVRPNEGALRRLVTGKTLKMMNSFGYFGRDEKIRLTETSHGQRLQSSGTWSVKDSNLCHSIRDGHEFCTAIFVRNREMLCWPAIGWIADDVDYIRRCSILSGDRAS